MLRPDYILAKKNFPLRFKRYKLENNFFLTVCTIYCKGFNPKTVKVGWSISEKGTNLNRKEQNSLALSHLENGNNYIVLDKQTITVDYLNLRVLTLISNYIEFSFSAHYFKELLGKATFNYLMRIKGRSQETTLERQRL